MRRFIFDKRFGRICAHAQFIGVLSAVALVLLIMASISGCNRCSRCDRSRRYYFSSNVIRAFTTKMSKILVLQRGWPKGQKLLPGQNTKITIRTEPTGDDIPATTKIVFTPPKGATNVLVESFGANWTERDDGTIVVEDWRVYDELEISFDAPELPEGQEEMGITATATAHDGSGGTSSSTQYTRVSDPAPPELRAEAQAPAIVTGPGRGAQEPTVWQVTRLGDPQGITLTTELCQDWLGFLQSDDVFVATTLPLSPTSQVDDAYVVPLVMADPYSATLNLWQYTPDTASLLTLPLELQPQRFSFLENEMPPPPGEHWIALGPATTTVTCPLGLNLPPNEWGIGGSFLLDMSHQPDGCQGCTLDLYYLYEGQDPPWPSSQLQSALAKMSTPLSAGGMHINAYQGEGITAIGPDRLLLSSMHLWELTGSSLNQITPTMPISLSNKIYTWPYPPAPMTFTLDYTSSLGSVWAFYSGTAEGPDLPLVEIDGPFRVDPPAATRYFWLVAQVPGDAALSPHTLVVTATRDVSPPERAAMSHLLWQGDWVAPPLPPGGEHRVYLPVVVRQVP